MDTKEKILRVAASEFSKHGYRDATIRSICRRASVNLALVNYHFGGKRSLYKEVVDYLVKKDPDFGKKNSIEYCDDKDWELGLYNYVSKLLEKVTDPSKLRSCLHRIFFREILDPSEMLHDFYNDYFILKIDELRGILIKKFGSSDPERLDIIVFSVISQCLFYGQNRALLSEYYSSDRSITSKINIEKIAEYITRQVKNCVELN